jgi:GNAT superfamily N-acetyltransferase
VTDWRIEQVLDDDQQAIEQVRELFAEYHRWLGEVVCSARLGEEIVSLPGPYAAPAGRLFIARDLAGVPTGCIGVRPHEGERCEIKRLYVRRVARGTGLGRALIEQAIEAAAALGYAEALVTTLPDTMPVAAAMYARLGFTETEPFFDHSHVEKQVPMTYLRLVLGENEEPQ